MAKTPQPCPHLDGTEELRFELFRDIEKVEVGPKGAVLSFIGGADAELSWNAPVFEPLVRRLADQGLSLTEWGEAVTQAGAHQEAQHVLGFLMSGRLLVWWFGSPHRRFFEFLPIRGTFQPFQRIGDIERYRLSDLTVVSYREGMPTLFHPVSEAMLALHPEGLWLLPSILAQGRDALSNPTPPLPDVVAQILASSGFLTDPDAGPGAECGWTAWDWLAHRRTRHTGLFGAMVPETGIPVPESTDVRRARSGKALRLPPQPANSGASPLAAVMDARRSHRAPTAIPLTVGELSTVLWRVARYRTDRHPPGEKLAVRNVPGGGSLNEIEYYIAVNRCDGLDRGLYFYDGYDHVLDKVSDAGPALDRYLGEVARDRLFLDDALPDCVIVLTTRHARLAQKYYPVAYRLTLLHVGVAYEALYLAATELGLSPCAAGFADMQHFQALTGLNPFEETSVGEFALSGRRLPVITHAMPTTRQ